MLSNIFQRSQNFLQVIKMFAFVIATFLTCWFPYHAYFVYSYHNPEVELPILSDYSFVFVILFVIDNLHHPGSPIYHFVYSNHNPEVVLSFSSIEFPSNLSCSSKCSPYLCSIPSNNWLYPDYEISTHQKRLYVLLLVGHGEYLHSSSILHVLFGDC